MCPAYKYFAGNFEEKWLWKARGFDNPDVYHKAYASCMADLKARWPGTSASEEQQYELVCSRAGLIVGEPMPSWADITVAFLKSVGDAKVAYAIGGIIFGPWLIAFLTVRVLPAGVVRMLLRWLRTPDDTA
jgi:hypothetical protein